MRRVMIQACDRDTSKNATIVSHQAPVRVVGVVMHECLSGLGSGHGVVRDRDAEHGAEPEVRADTLVHHLVEDTAPTRVY